MARWNASSDESSTPAARPHLIIEALVELAALHLATGDRLRAVAVLLVAIDALGDDEKDWLAEYAADCSAGHKG